jgi:hypothetical protein
VAPSEFWDGPISLVAAEIHLGQWPAGICERRQRQDIQVLCQWADEIFYMTFNVLGRFDGTGAARHAIILHRTLNN